MSWSDLLRVFDDRDLLPHATCLLWRPDLLWFHAISDALIAAAYYSIPVALMVFAAKRRDLQFRWIFLLFGLFILACGTTHLLSVWTLWSPVWGLSGLVKAATAVTSVATAALLWPLIPKALAVPGPRQWAEINENLLQEIEDRRAVEAQIRTLNRELEDRVLRRTAELQAANGRLEQINKSLREEIERRGQSERDWRDDPATAGPSPTAPGLARLDGSVEGIAAALLDREQALREAKQEAERANQAKSAFLAAASHDLRQPAQSLMLFSSALATATAGQPAAELVSHIKRAVAGLKYMLDGILDTSRLDAGVVTPEISSFRLGPLLERLAAEYQMSARKKALELRWVSSGLWVTSDQTLLERILRNLVENAIKYTSRGKVLIGCRREASFARIEVHDTGIGIPQDQQNAVFQEFYQLNNPERDRTKGLGLGLAIVRRLAELLAHRIRVLSTPGRGTCFAVCVPISKPGTIRETPPVVPVAQSGLVVVIEDDEDVRAGLQAELQTWGYEVIAGVDHSDILAKLGDKRPDIILADFRLHGSLTGIEAIGHLHRAFGEKTPSVLLTGDTASERIAEARRSGYGLLHKPVSALELRKYLRGLARKA